jgi:segregation and condensation protein A
MTQVAEAVDYGASVPEQPADLPIDAAVADATADTGKFTVRLANFTGPFDLLLQLIGKHKLDVTEVALHQVTDEFIAYIRAMGDDWDLGEASEFLLIAATLLDLKAARLLPAAEVEDEEDLALLEARDLLFARLLQYKAFKEAAAHICELEAVGVRRWPRAVSLEQRYAEALPDLVLGIGAQRLLKLAVRVMSPKPLPPEVSIAHIHQVRVSVREHATLLRDRIMRAGTATFTLLTADCESTLEIVARFLALLELYRENLIDFEQPVSLDELTVRWIGGAEAGGELDIDEYAGSPPPIDTAALDPQDAAALAAEFDDAPDLDADLDADPDGAADLDGAQGLDVDDASDLDADGTADLDGDGDLDGTDLDDGFDVDDASNLDGDADADLNAAPDPDDHEADGDGLAADNAAIDVDRGEFGLSGNPNSPRSDESTDAHVEEQPR